MIPDKVYSKTMRKTFQKDTLNLIIDYFRFNIPEAALQRFIKKLDVSEAIQEEIWKEYCRWYKEVYK